MKNTYTTPDNTIKINSDIDTETLAKVLFGLSLIQLDTIFDCCGKSDFIEVYGAEALALINDFEIYDNVISIDGVPVLEFNNYAHTHINDVYRTLNEITGDFANVVLDAVNLHHCMRTVYFTFRTPNAYHAVLQSDDKYESGKFIGLTEDVKEHRNKLLLTSIDSVALASHIEGPFSDATDNNRKVLHIVDAAMDLHFFRHEHEDAVYLHVHRDTGDHTVMSRELLKSVNII